MRRTRPWGLPERLLAPGKVITDPVHDDIYLTELEIQLVDSPPFQRLRKVRQLGFTHLVYPGATHSRFSHSVGALKVAQDLIDTVIDQRSGRDPDDDLFTQWQADLIEDGKDELSADGLREFNERLAKVTVLARLGALLHDFCHVPYGHSIEDDLGILKAHDKNRERFERLWAETPQAVRGPIDEGEGLKAELERLVLPAADHQGKSAFPFVDDVVGNTICADLLDYLRRDHLFTGLPLALGRRFEAGFYVLPEGDPKYGKQMVLRVHRQREERIDTITEILKHLRYRYELSERALVHHAKLAADAMVGKALEIWRDALWAELAADALTDPGHEADWAPGRDLDELWEALKGAGESPKVLRKEVRRELDAFMTRHGDEGLLEYLRELPTAPRPSVRHRDGSRRRTVAHLAQMLEERKLFKRIAVQHRTREPRDAFYGKHGRAEDRRRVEQRAARFAGVDPAWKVLVWLPSPKMRLKVAGVLVDDGKEIRKFVDREEDGKKRGADIYEAHRNLWAVSVYVHPELKHETDVREMLLASLAADLDIQLGNLEDRLGPSPHEWPDRLALELLARDLERPRFPESEVKDLLREHREQVAARGDREGRPSMANLKAEYRELLD
jgi:HD superfamily phosphohydrolase